MNWTFTGDITIITSMVYYNWMSNEKEICIVSALSNKNDSVAENITN